MHAICKDTSAGDTFLVRASISADHRVKAQFSDNSILLLSSNGDRFIHSDRDAVRVVQLCEFAMSRYVRKLAQVVHFRNMHLDQPVYSSRLTAIKTGAEAFVHGYEIKSVRWSSCVDSVHGNVMEMEDGKMMLLSEEGLARMLLHQGGWRVAVTYPLLVKVDQGEHHYVQQCQTFSVENCPERWKSGLLILLDYWETRHPVRDDMHWKGKCRVFPQTLEHIHPLEGSQSLTLTSNLPICHRPAQVLQTQDEFPEGSWWFQPTAGGIFARDVPIIIDWNPEATYEYIDSEAEIEIGVWLHCEETYLRTTQKGRFFQHFRLPMDENRTYSAAHVPKAIWSNQCKSHCPLEIYAAQAIKMRCSLERICLHGFDIKGSEVQSRSNAEHASSCVLEEHQVNGLGIFTAYEDRRVRIRFSDRTLLNMNASHTRCSLILSNGQCVNVTSKIPVGVEHYVKSAIEFASWVFQSPSERGRAMKIKEDIELAAEKCLRTAAICDWALSRKRKIKKCCTENTKLRGNYLTSSDCR